MNAGNKIFDLDDVDDEPIRVNYSDIENSKKESFLINKKCQLTFPYIRIEIERNSVEKKTERKLISFSEFDTFEQNRLKIYEMFSKEWKIVSETMKTTDHFIEIEKEI